MKADIGVIGLAVMGQNLVLNMESKGYKVAVYNRTAARTQSFAQGPARGKENIIPCYSLEEFVASLKRPRKIMVMVKAGKPVDAVIESIVPLLEEGDVIVDGGNSYFKDTIRRYKWLKDKRIHFLGTGISGGEEGALKGPSIMPGGSKEAWDQVGGILKDISAKVEGVPCCEYLGPDGAGHYVKMVHNGIEYADMQLIAEAYFLMRNVLKMSPDQMKEVFANWNKGDLNSYLIEITADILGKTDEETGKPMVDVILDKAGQKGTGKWTAQEALDLGVPVPTIAEAVFARCISALKEQRIKASSVFNKPDICFSCKYDEKGFINAVEKALYASKICAYAQGFALLRTASEEYGWGLDLGRIALLWRGGCIIRAQFLDRIKEAYERNKDLPNLLLDPYFAKIIKDSHRDWRNVVRIATGCGAAIPAFSSALAYYDSYRSEILPANLVQAQRDYFGAHTYERIDKEGIFHTDWNK